MVLTNNLHIYEHHWNLLDTHPSDYSTYPKEVYAILQGQTVKAFQAACAKFIDSGQGDNVWLRKVAYPARKAYSARASGESDGSSWVSDIKCETWRVACMDYICQKEA